MIEHRRNRLQWTLSSSLLLGLMFCVLLGATLHGVGVASAEPAGVRPVASGSRDTGPDSRGAAPGLRDTSYNFYVGNLHSHTSYSDGTGTPAWAYRYARDTARIDFLAVTDHHNMLSDLEYEDVLFQADEYCDDGVFVAIAGQEWSGSDTSGTVEHHATVFGADHVLTAPLHDVPAFYQELLESGAIGILAHPAMASFDSLAYSAIGDAGVCAVEVRNVFYEPQYITLLDNGWRLGADGSQDNHQPNWGDGPRWTVALACSLTRDHIIDAVRSHRTYSTTDRELELKFRAQGCWMGGELEHEGDIVFSVDIADTNETGDFTRIELFQNGQVVSSVVPSGNPFSWHPEITPPPGDNYYFVKVFQDDIDRAWSAPIWTRGATGLPDVEDDDLGPATLRLSPGCPNPFTSGATMQLALSGPGRVTVKICDPAGRLVRTLVDDSLPAGEHRLAWDGRDCSGRHVASGVYFVRAEAASQSASRKVVLLR